MDDKKLKEYEPFWGNWYIDSLIGEGSFGSVYKIVREEFGEKYYSALKIISIPKTQNEVKRIRFEGLDEADAGLYFKGVVEDIYKEIAMMARLKGKSNIVSYEDHQIVERKNEIGYEIFIRMELLQGLNDYVMTKTLTNEEIVRMGKEICTALTLCEKHNIMHRDIKPDNIFISKDGDFKLGDFGIARQLEKSDGGLSIKGSYEFMAPEVYLGRDYDMRVDIYSLGIVLYSFLNCNKIPFLSTESKQVKHKQRQEAMRSRFMGAKIPRPVLATEALGNVILKALEFNPDERYANAEEFYGALDALSERDLVRLNEEDLIFASIQEKNLTMKIENIISSVPYGERECPNQEMIFYKPRTSDLQFGDLIKRVNTITPTITGKDKFRLPEDENGDKLEDSAQEEPKPTVHPFKEVKISNSIKIKFILVLVGLFVLILISVKLKDNINNADKNAKVENTNQPTPKPTASALEEADVQQKTVILSGEGVTTLSNIKNIEKITVLDISNNKISDISDLENSVYMDAISMQNNQIESLGGIAGMKKLEYLDATCNKIKDISLLANLRQLTVLTLSSNQISDITAISNLSRLSALHLDDNSITNIDALKGLKNLEFLDLSGNKIIDFIPLLELSNLKHLILSDITEQQLADLENALPNCEFKIEK